MELLEQITHLADTLAYLLSGFMYVGIFILGLITVHVVFSILEDRRSK